MDIESSLDYSDKRINFGASKLKLQKAQKDKGKEEETNNNEIIENVTTSCILKLFKNLLDKKKKIDEEDDENAEFDNDDQDEEHIHYEKKDIKSVFFKNLSLRTTEEDLKTFLENNIQKNFKNSHILATRIVLDNKGFSRGIAYVDFPNLETANRCVNACNQQKLDDNEITCVISKPPSSG